MGREGGRGGRKGGREEGRTGSGGREGGRGGVTVIHTLIQSNGTRVFKYQTRHALRNNVGRCLPRKGNGTRRNSSGGLEELGEEGIDMLLDLLPKIFEQEKMPEEWRDSVSVPIFKEKGASRIVGITEASR